MNDPVFWPGASFAAGSDALRRPRAYEIALSVLDLNAKPRDPFADWYGASFSAGGPSPKSFHVYSSEGTSLTSYSLVERQ